MVFKQNKRFSMKFTPIEIASMFYLEKKTRFQIAAVLNIPIFYAEKCIERFTEQDVLELETDKKKAVIKVTKRFNEKRKQPLKAEAFIPVKKPFERHFGHKNECYWKNEMEYGYTRTEMSTTELIAKFN